MWIFPRCQVEQGVSTLPMRCFPLVMNVMNLLRRQVTPQASWQYTLKEIINLMSESGWECIVQTVPFPSRSRVAFECLQISAMHKTENVYCVISRDSRAYCMIRLDHGQTVTCVDQEDMLSILDDTLLKHRSPQMNQKGLLVLC